MANALAFAPAGAAKLRSPPETEVRTALARRNPRAPGNIIDDVAKLAAAFVRTVAGLSDAERRRIPLAEDRLRELLLDAPRGSGEAAPERLRYEASGPVERSRGAGLGERVEPEEGLARLAAYAAKRPIESWAGPVAGAGGVEAELGVPRSTLNDWHRRGAVVGLLRGERKRVYPLEQFVDARPVPGVAAVLGAAPDARAAWLWLRQPHGAFGSATPLDALKQGRAEEVATAAARDFD